MSLDADLKKAFEEFKKTHAFVFPATVKSINQESKTITVTDIDGLEFNDVRLASAEDNIKSIITVPKVSSTVLVCQIGNDLNTLFVAKINEVEKVIGTIETVEFEINENGYLVKRGSEVLKTVLNDMIDEINQIRVIYGNTINVVAMNQIKSRLNTILID